MPSAWSGYTGLGGIEELDAHIKKRFPFLDVPDDPDPRMAEADQISRIRYFGPHVLLMEIYDVLLGRGKIGPDRRSPER